jgi:protein-L-isoaspartate(D-aspartate) O-methyltransferase
MILPIGESRDTQQLVQIDKTKDGLVVTELLPVRFVPLLHGVAKDPERESFRDIGKDR